MRIQTLLLLGLILLPPNNTHAQEIITGTPGVGGKLGEFPSLEEALQAGEAAAALAPPADLVAPPLEHPWFDVQNHPGYGVVEVIPPPGSE